ncbi:MAG: hypothetical protein ACOYKE_08345 [Ferruginibacter sp.]
MKKIVFSLLLVAGMYSIGFAQKVDNKKSATPAAKVKLVEATDVEKKKQEAELTAAKKKNVVKTDAKTGVKTLAAGPVKKDGTPDKRYKSNKKLKKDGTPDKRYSENKQH